jgi:chemotaxis signal transduction protein
MTTLHKSSGDSEDASCRLTIGVWGDSSCALLQEHIHCRNCPVYARGGRLLLARSHTVTEARLDTLERESRTTAALQALMVFRVRGERVAIRAASAREVVEPTTLHRVPHRGDRRFLGLANVRGEILPVADIAELLEMPALPDAGGPPRNTTRLLVIERSGEAWVLPVAGIDGIHRADLDALLTPPVTVELGRAAFTSGVLETPDGPIAVLDEETLWYALQRICR